MTAKPAPLLLTNYVGRYVYINLRGRFTVKQLFHLSMIVAIAIVCTSCSKTDTKPPSVVETFPVTGSTDVDPAITEISVTFDEPMTDRSWSWAYTNKEQFPERRNIIIKCSI